MSRSSTETVVIGVAVIAVAVGAAQLLDPTLDQSEPSRQQQTLDLGGTGGGSSTEEGGDERARGEAEQKALAGERRLPDKPRVKIKFRLP